MQDFPPVQWASRHPRVAAWIVLSTGMIGLIAYEGRNVGLLPRQWIALFIACVLVAGLCIWIISWEDDIDEVETTTTPQTSSDINREDAA